MFRGVNQLEKHFEGAIDETRQRGHGRMSKREATRMILRFSTCTTEEMEGFSFLSLFFFSEKSFPPPHKKLGIAFFCFGQINLGIAANHSHRILKYQLDNLNWCLGKAQIEIRYLQIAIWTQSRAMRIRKINQICWKSEWR